MPSPDEIRNFFAWSDFLDHEVLRPLSHIRGNWEATWDGDDRCYIPEEDSFAEDLNALILDISITAPPLRYHDNEDILANFVINRLGWPIRKENGRWVGADYEAILEQGGLNDVAQDELLAAVAGRVHAAFRYGQTHFDEMELSHQRMVSAIMAIILYHRS
ncbi:MAG TPA: hypothetical protein VK196_09895 [Magnetospirillum sp.]|nr:hypothetical protein [Magnetospirillum sp.]